MPSPTTALTIIRDALGLTNAVGAEQTLTADETTDCLRAFNDLLEIFSTKSLAVFGQLPQTFNTVVGQGTYTVGIGGNWAISRPERIIDPGYSVINGASYPLWPMTQGEYDAIAFKAQTQDYPTSYLYVNDFPLGRLVLFPVPSAVTPITLPVERQLTAVASAGTSISYPPGYSMVFTYKLAIMLAPKFGKKIRDYPEIVQIATDSFADICRPNKKLRVMHFESSPIASPLQRFLGG